MAAPLPPAETESARRGTGSMWGVRRCPAAGAAPPSPPTPLPLPTPTLTIQYGRVPLKSGEWRSGGVSGGALPSERSGAGAPRAVTRSEPEREPGPELEREPAADRAAPAVSGCPTDGMSTGDRSVGAPRHHQRYVSSWGRSGRLRGTASSPEVCVILGSAGRLRGTASSPEVCVVLGSTRATERDRFITRGVCRPGVDQGD